jgi:hypothetical protein
MKGRIHLRLSHYILAMLFRAHQHLGAHRDDVVAGAGAIVRPCRHETPAFIQCRAAPIGGLDRIGELVRKRVLDRLTVEIRELAGPISE